MDTPVLGNNHAFLAGDMMQFQESFCGIRPTWHSNYIAYCFGVVGPYLYRAFSIRSSNDLEPSPGQWHLEYAVVLLPTLLFFDVESSAISCRRKNTQKNIRALRSICSPERRRFCTELEVGIAVPGSAIHGYRLLN
jgi:hypothetical protein